MTPNQIIRRACHDFLRERTFSFAGSVSRKKIESIPDEIADAITEALNVQQIGSRCITEAGRCYFFTRDLDHSTHKTCVPLYRIGG